MMRRSGRAVFPAVILSLATLGLSLAVHGLWPAMASAQMYRWTDEEGGIHYTPK